MKRHPRSFWVGLVAEVEGGRDVDEVARRHKVNAGTLRWWRTQLRGRPRLLPVVTVAAQQAPRRIEIGVGGALVRVEEGTDVAYIAALARALGGTC